MDYKLSHVQDLLILENATVQFISIFSDSVTMATKVIIKELSMNDFVLGENKQVPESFVEI